MSAKYEVEFFGGGRATLRGWKATVGYKLTAISPWLASFWVRFMADEWRGAARPDLS